MKYSKLENIQPLQSRFTFSEISFVQTCSDLFFGLWRSFLQQVSGLCMWRSSTEDIGPWDERRAITKGQGRHRIQEGSASRGCKIRRQRVQVLWWTDQRSHRIIFGKRVYWQKSWKCWVIIKGIGSPSLDPLEIAKGDRFGLLPSMVDQKICRLQGRLAKQSSNS